MGILNALNCVKPGTGNTGYGDCVLDIGRIVGLILVPKDTEIVFTDVATLKTAIAAAILSNDPYSRYYPVSKLVPQADNSGDLSVQTYPDGTVVVTGEGNYDWTFDQLGGKNCLASRLRKHNGSSEDVLLIDQYGHLLGINGVAANSIKGFSPSIKFALAPVLSPGNDAVTAYRYRLSFDKSQLADNLAVVDFGTDKSILSLTGLQDVALSQGAARAANVVTIKAKTACGTVDMYDLYADALAVVGAWAVTRTSTGNVITVTGVAKNANVKGWDITVDSSDPDYVATAGQLTISLAGPTTLNGLASPVKGFESNTITQ